MCPESGSYHDFAKNTAMPSGWLPAHGRDGLLRHSIRTIEPTHCFKLAGSDGRTHFRLAPDGEERESKSLGGLFWPN